MPANLCAPVDVQIELTQACNWKCHHCYNHWRTLGEAHNPTNHLSNEQLQKIVDELIANKIPSTTITGGEPFLRREQVFTLLKLAQETGIHASINSNLSLVSEEDLERLSQDHRGTSILFSLLSPNACKHERLAGTPKGTYDRVLDRAKHALAKGVPVSLNMVLMRDNIHDIELMAQLAKSIGVRTFCATKALPNTNAPDSAFLLTPEEVRYSLDKLMHVEHSLNMPVDILGCYPRCLFIDMDAFKRFSHRTCVAGYTTATIGATGQVRPCSHMNNSYGNIFQKPLKDIWEAMKGWRKGDFIPSECHDCSVVVSCRGGCRVCTLSQGLKNLDLYADPEQMTQKQRLQTKNTQNIDLDALPECVVVCPNTCFRDESFGALVYTTDPLSIMLINRSAAMFLKRKQQHASVFTLENFLKQSGARTKKQIADVKRLYQKLVYKGLLNPHPYKE